MELLLLIYLISSKADIVVTSITRKLTRKSKYMNMVLITVISLCIAQLLIMWLTKVDVQVGCYWLSVEIDITQAQDRKAMLDLGLVYCKKVCRRD